MRDVAFISNNAVLDFELSRCRAHVNKLVRKFHELIEIQRPVIERARQTETIIHQHGFARTITFIHPANLRNGRVRFIDHDEKIFREKVDDRIGL